MSAEFSYFGKLPAFGDFIRWNATKQEIRQFDKWLQEGIYHAKSELGADFDRAFKGLNVGFFMPNEDTDNILLGGMRASLDKVGRHYPFYATILIENSGHFGHQSFAFPPLAERFLTSVFPFLQSIETSAELPQIEHEFENLIESVQSSDSAQNSVNKREDFDADQTLINLNGRSVGYAVSLANGGLQNIYPILSKFFWGETAPHLFWSMNNNTPVLYVFGSTPSPHIFTNILDHTRESQFIEQISLNLS
jgi:type VI secretion system ImpM family protein